MDPLLLPLGVVALVAALMVCNSLVKVWPGEVVGSYRKGSRRVEKIYKTPGLHWRGFSRKDAVLLRLWVDEPAILVSRPVEARTHDDASVILTVRLTMDVTDPSRYVTAVVGKELEEWQEEVLSTLIANVVSGYMFTQVLNDREQVAHNIVGAVATWFAGRGTPDFGLAFRRAAIVEATSPPMPMG